MIFKNLSGNADVEIFPFDSGLGHCEVIIRHLDGESQDIELTPDEADQISYEIKAAADEARKRAQAREMLTE